MLHVGYIYLHLFDICWQMLANIPTPWKIWDIVILIVVHIVIHIVVHLVIYRNPCNVCFIHIDLTISIQCNTNGGPTLYRNPVGIPLGSPENLTEAKVGLETEQQARVRIAKDESHGSMERLWENYRKTIGKWWFHGIYGR